MKMAHSAKIQKILAEVKMGLSILYGADYFTEEEWVKVDALIHKGKYVFTNGPPTNIVDQQLLSFEEPDGVDETDDQKKDNGKSTGDQAFVHVAEQESPPSSNGEIHPETPLETSEESSSDEEIAAVPTAKSVPPMFDFSEKSPPAPAASVDPATKYTKEQLEEARAFLSQATKGGEKKKKGSSHAPVEDYASSSWTQDPQTQFSPAPADREAMIASWASEVDASDVIERKSDVGSTITTTAVTTMPDPSKLVERFIKEKQRLPRSTNDFYQPNNPSYKKGGESSESVYSGKSAMKVGSKASSIRQLAASVTDSKNSMPKLNVNAGTILIAQRDFPKTSSVILDVRAGDQIRVLKHVCGTRHHGKNMRTGLAGQFSEDVFKAPTPTKGAVAPQLVSIAKAASPQTIATARVVAEEALAKEREQARRVELDEIEETNAAEWDEVPVRRQKPTVPVVFKTENGLTASGFSVLEKLDTQREINKKQEHTPAQVKGFEEMVGNEVDRILKLRGIPITPESTSNAGVKTTEVCWFWKTGKGCRFTADECMNLHEDSPTGTIYPLRNGKPTWGSKADVALSVTSPTPSISLSLDPRRNTLTCHFWKSGFCTKSAEMCTYLHADSPAGVATKPVKSGYKGPAGKSKALQMESWVRELKEGENGSDDGELILEEVKDEQSSLWGTPWAGSGLVSIWADDKYKPPHVVALENKVMQQRHGW